MKSFIEFIKEDIKIDNPGGQWLKNKQEDADKGYSKRKGIEGSVTGYYKTNHKLPVDKIKNIPGARGEEEYRNDETNPKSQDLSKEIGHPSNFNTQKNPILIGVNHRGEPHVVEGNHRLAYAVKNKIPHIHAEVKYYNGGESVNGGFHPDDVKKMKVD